MASFRLSAELIDFSGRREDCRRCMESVVRFRGSRGKSAQFNLDGSMHLSTCAAVIAGATAGIANPPMSRERAEFIALSEAYEREHQQG